MQKILTKAYNYLGLETGDWNWMQLLFGKHYIGAILLMLLLFSLSCFSQTMEKNLFAENEILNLFLQVNPKMRDSPELNYEANIALLEWVSNLLTILYLVEVPDT